MGDTADGGDGARTDNNGPTTLLAPVPTSFSASDLEDCMRVYYQKLFPFKLFYRWLSYGNLKKNYFQHREFSFTLKGDIYVRYNSFNDVEQFSKTITKDNPTKIDIGAVYNAAPRDHNKGGISNFVPLEKEFVLDIDMDPYNEIRVCCSKSNICHKCWAFIIAAIKVLTAVLSEDFGFQSILWVYSGRRGVHCWVADERARKMFIDARGAIIEYMNVIKGDKDKNRRGTLPLPLHPALQRAYKTLEPIFEDRILEEQEVLAPENWDKVLSFIPDFSKDLRDDMKERWERDGSSTSAKVKWAQLKKTLTTAMNNKKIRFQNPIVEIVFHYAYPRLDVEVSKGLNHLLKAPFCVHPATGRVCVPIDPRACEDFDPLAVVTVAALVQELDNAIDRKEKDYKKTSLAPSIEFFKTSFLKPLEASVRQQAVQQRDQEAADRVDF